MTAADSPSAADQLTATYEALRAAVLAGQSRGQLGLAILVHRGLAAWIGQLRQGSPAMRSPEPATPSNVSAPPPTELTRVLAGIIVALTTGGTHAHA